MRRFLTPVALAVVMSTRLDGQVAQPAGLAPRRATGLLTTDRALTPHAWPTAAVANGCWRSMGHWIGFGMLGGMVVGGTIAVVDVARTDHSFTAPGTVFSGVLLGGVGGGVLGAIAYVATHGKPDRSSSRCVSPNVRWNGRADYGRSLRSQLNFMR